MQMEMVESDSPILAIYGNPNISNDEPLEVNGRIPNLMVLSDSSSTGGSSAESGSGPPSPHDRNEDGGSRTLAYMEVVTRFASSV